MTEPISSPKVEVQTRIILPEIEDVDRRRRALLDHPDSDLHLRCHAKHGVCLHTLSEVMHLHGHSEESGSSSDHRMLASASSPGVAYANVAMDSFAINNNDGFVSWIDSKAGGGPKAPANMDTLLEEDKIEYDQHGCIIEEGFETQAYPFTLKHCYGFRQTKDCTFILGESGYQGYESALLYPFNSEENPTGTEVPEFIVPGGLVTDCTTIIGDKTSGFCECGSGFKVKVGKCEDPAKPYSVTAGANTCAKVCFEHARDAEQLTVDLYHAQDQRLVHIMSLDTNMASVFFDIQKSELGEYSANIMDSVYVTTRLAYRRETPVGFGEESWPSWLDWHHHVRGHYTPESVSADGLEWSDVSGKNRHAQVTSGTLEKYALNHPSGDRFNKVVLTGTTDTTIEFDSTLFPPTYYPYEKNANFISCPLCEDFSSEIS